MGCTRSKLEPDDEDAAAAAAAAAVAGVGASRSGRRRRRRRGGDIVDRKGGFVAAAELLPRPEEPDAGAESQGTDGTKGDAEGEERRGSGLGLGFVGNRRRGAEEEEDDLRGSPSFRFYFDRTPLTGSDNGDDDSAVKENGNVTGTGNGDLFRFMYLHFTGIITHFASLILLKQLQFGKRNKFRNRKCVCLCACGAF